MTEVPQSAGLEDRLYAQTEIEAGAPRSAPPDNPFDYVRTFSSE
jgi:hypothetical protein